MGSEREQNTSNDEFYAGYMTSLGGGFASVTIRKSRKDGVLASEIGWPLALS